jgi:DNA-binding GntR family transcriptional regulator
MSPPPTRARNAAQGRKSAPLREDLPTGPETEPDASLTAASDGQFSRVKWLADILRERIIGGVYPAGTRIREITLQKEFAFSNGPIREALQQLVADGLAVRAPWQGVRVIELGSKEIAQLFELRSALLEYAAEQAARIADERAAKSAAVLRSTLASKFAAARAGNPPPVTGATTDWVMEVAGNPEITAVWQKTMLKSRIYVYSSMKRTAGTSTEPIIEALISAILDHKAAAARRAARDLTLQMLLDIGIGPDGEALEGKS